MPYSYEAIPVREAVEHAATGDWEVPDFQRKFVWDPVQVRDLAESLWLEYPVGSLLFWNGARQGDGAGGRHQLWLIDGQQRVTALCLLFGRQPRWWERRNSLEWERAMLKYDVRFDIEAVAAPFFTLADTAMRASHDPRYVPLRTLLSSQNLELENLVRDLRARDQGLATTLGKRLERVARIRDNPLMTTMLDHELENALEIFRRLNSRGIRFRRFVLQLLMRRLGTRWEWPRAGSSTLF